MTEAFLEKLRSQVKLSPPWETLQSKFANTIGCDHQVTVGSLDTSQNPAVIAVVVDDEKKGTSLATILRDRFPTMGPGYIDVVVHVKNSKGARWHQIETTSPEQLLEAFKAAFSGNPLFVEAKLIKLDPKLSYVVLIIAKAVVQFYNSDLSDFYCNFNGVAAHVIESDVIKMEFAHNDSVVSIAMGTATTSEAS